MRLRDLPADVNDTSSEIWAAAIKVHETLGPYLLESAYRRCLAHELRRRGRRAEEEVWLALEYEGLRVDGAFRVDLLVDERVVVELKCVPSLTDEHQAQLMTYLQLSGICLGLLFNMRAPRLIDDFRRRAMRPNPLLFARLRSPPRSFADPGAPTA